jgi:S-adenosylmethionine hydrolase
MNHNNNYPISRNEWETNYYHAHDYSADGRNFFCLTEASQYQGNAAIDHLVDAATKTTAPASVIERDLNGTHLKKTHSVVDHFYSVLSVLPDSHTSQTELSIGNQIFATAWGQLQLQKDHFTGNPHCFVGHSTLIEAELMDSLQKSG